jgi:hypothetical protein
MLTFRRPPWSLLAVLAVVVGAGALIGQAVNAAGIAAFCLFISSIEPKPAWRYFFDAPDKPDTGRSLARFFSWRRVAPVSPQEQRRLPPID